jgi:hypothetical protein
MHSFPASPAHTRTHAHTHTLSRSLFLQASTPEKEAELLEAAKEGDMTKAQTLLKAGVSVDCRDGVCLWVWVDGWVGVGVGGWLRGYSLEMMRYKK